MRKKYEDGYLGKVLYWTEQVELAALEGKWFKLERAMAKLSWFGTKHSDWLYEKSEQKVEEKLG